jgi:hypothetical protein
MGPNPDDIVALELTLMMMGVHVKAAARAVVDVYFPALRHGWTVYQGRAVTCDKACHLPTQSYSLPSKVDC